MKTSLAGIACLAWFIIILNLSQRGDAQFLDESCKSSTPTQAGAWMVVLRNKTHFLCAGSLINRQFVLTAAQCIEGQGTLIASLGAKDLNHRISEVPVKNAHIHRLYSRQSGLNNIGLVKLLHPVEFTDQVRPICILRSVTAQNEFQFKSFKTFGWGMGTGRNITKNNRAEINIGNFKSVYCDIGSEQSSYFCGGPSLEGSCGGDIGGPLSNYVKFNDQEELPVQFGLENFLGQGKCGGARPYIDVASYADWIERIVRSYDEPKASQDTKIQRSKTQVTEDMRLYSRCGETYLTANIYGPDFMAKGVMITHRFVLTTARELPEDVSFLRVGVEGFRHFEEMTIDSFFKHPDGFKTDLALLKLASELIPENIMKPICILRRPPVEQSLPQLTVLDIDRRETNANRSFKVAPSIEKLNCSASLRKQLKSSEICVQTPPGIKQVFGIRGNVVSQKIMIPGKNTTMHPLFGIVNYSESGINVITDVSSYTNWIASIVRENSV